MTDVTSPVTPIAQGFLTAVETRGVLGPLGFGRDELQEFTPSFPPAIGGATFGSAPAKTRGPIAEVTYTGTALEAHKSSSGFIWFDHFHVMPRSIALGNVASDTSIAVDVFSAHRRISASWLTFTNNAGAGTVLNGEPALPASIVPFNSFPGVTLDVDSEGAPFVNSTLVFTFTGSETITVPITLQRLAMWIVKPELRYREILEWLTNVYRAKSGKEKRERLRGSPRVTYRYNFRLPDSDADRQYMENEIFFRQASTVGMPLWKKGAALTTAAIATDTVLNVASTSFRDFRAGAPAVIFADGDTRSFDTHEIQSLTATTITLTAPLDNGYAAGLFVYPVQVCRLPASVAGQRWTVGMTEFAASFEVVDNDLDIGDLTAFNSHMMRLLMDQGNSMRGGATKSESHLIDLLGHDSLTGLSSRVTSNPNSRRSTALELYTKGHQQEWETRQMFYALAGRQASFEYPRAGPDMVATVALGTASLALQIENIGYTQFVNAAQPRNTVRVNKTDGTSLIRTIVSATEVSLTEELLTVNTAWGENIALAAIDSIELVERSRLNSDVVEIDHDVSGAGVARFSTSLVGVLE